MKYVWKMLMQLSRCFFAIENYWIFTMTMLEMIAKRYRTQRGTLEYFYDPPYRFSFQKRQTYACLWFSERYMYVERKGLCRRLLPKRHRGMIYLSLNRETRGEQRILNIQHSQIFIIRQKRSLSDLAARLYSLRHNYSRRNGNVNVTRG